MAEKFAGLDVLVDAPVVGAVEGSKGKQRLHFICYIMKRIGGLFERIISMENLRRADERARRGKRKSYGVRMHDKNREGNLEELHERLLTGMYRTSEYSVFTIHEPKEREIYRLPYYPDRIVHHAIMNVMEETWTRTMTHNTYACIRGRGIEGCARRVRKMIRRFDGGELYCLKIDIKKFYPSISHRVLKRIVRRKIKDGDALRLIDEIVDSAPGLPIGNYLSQYLANLTLCYVMHWVNEEMARAVQKRLGLKERPRIEAAEYADDIVFLAASKEVLHEAMKLVRGKIEGELELRVKENWQVFPIAENRQDRRGRALDYVGYQFFRRQTLMRKSIKKNLCRKAARLGKKKEPLADKDFKRAVAPWLGWAKHSDSRNLIKKVLTNKRKDLGL